uniref:Glutathione peroxidase (Fragments) n=1 Tax=Schistosoma mansoni TaxID=6183 RepID=Q7M448_SCHMA
SWNSIYEFTVKYRGHVCLIVNVACKATDNYRQLQEMHTRLVGKGLRILAFPCNQFGGQEPWAEAEIKFVTEKYGVQFDMFSKFLKSRQHGTLTNNIKWNFSKFLVDRQGQPVKRYSPTTAPYDIEGDIMELLEK